MRAIVLPHATADVVLPFLSFDIMFNGNNYCHKTLVKRVSLSGRRFMIIYARSFNNNTAVPAGDLILKEPIKYIGRCVFAPLLND